MRWQRRRLDFRRGIALALVLGWLSTPPTPALAGPHAGGTVILHANSTIVYSSDPTDCCGQSGLSTCAAARTEVTADPTITTVFYAFAAFPSDSEPELTGVTFGIQYDSETVTLVDTGYCSQYELNTSDWPFPGSGTALTWDLPQPGYLIELRWFAAYVESPELPSTFELIAHPSQGGTFTGGGLDWPLDDIADYGELGFGMDGYLPCPDGPTPTDAQSWGSVKATFR